MKKISKLFIGLLVACLFLVTGCSSSNESSDKTADDSSSEESTSWYTGPGYDTLYSELGKADVDLSNADGLLKEIIEKGVITLATSPDYPPNEFVDTDGTVKGSDIMLAQYIANSLGVELQIETMDFNAVLTAVDTGKVDMGISGLVIKKIELNNLNYLMAIKLIQPQTIIHY